MLVVAQGSTKRLAASFRPELRQHLIFVILPVPHLLNHRALPLANPEEGRELDLTVANLVPNPPVRHHLDSFVFCVNRFRLFDANSAIL